VLALLSRARLGALWTLSGVGECRQPPGPRPPNLPCPARFLIQPGQPSGDVDLSAAHAVASAGGVGVVGVVQSPPMDHRASGQKSADLSRLVKGLRRSCGGSSSPATSCDAERRCGPTRVTETPCSPPRHRDQAPTEPARSRRREQPVDYADVGVGDQIWGEPGDVGRVTVERPAHVGPGAGEQRFRSPPPVPGPGPRWS